MNAKPLKVVIVGAGIGGLTAAIGLRREGHEVHVYESSSFSKELGAALHVGPHANGILKRLGVDVKATGAVLAQFFTQYSGLGGQQTLLQPLSIFTETWQHEWLLAHRVKLHDSLRTTATSSEGLGIPVVLHLSHRVKDVDPIAGVVYFTNGSSARGDVIVGADGVHSATRRVVPGADKEPFSTGISAFRFMIPTEKLLNDPATRKFVERNGEQVGVFAPGKILIMYPTSDNELTNVIALHPESESTTNKGWGSQSSKASLLNVYKDFHSDFKSVLDKVDEGSIKAWQLLDMESISHWTYDKLVLLGDAAHPFLPYQGQGSSMAIEDAAALSVVLERGLKPEEVSERMQLYQDIRQHRVNVIQDQTRHLGKVSYVAAPTASSTEEEKKNAGTFGITIAYNHNHDEFDNSIQKLREWKWSREGTVCRGPKTVVDEPPSVNIASVPSQSRFVSASVTFKSSRTLMQNLLPVGAGWNIQAVGTFAYCTFIATQNDQEESSLGFYIHGVQQAGPTDHSTGTFAPISFTSEIEDSELPAASSVVEVRKNDSSCHFTASRRGQQWMRIDIKALESFGQAKAKPITLLMQQPPSDDSFLIHHYQPHGKRHATGIAGKTGLSRNPLPRSSVSVLPEAIWESHDADIQVNLSSSGQLRAINHIVKRLAELPVYSIESARVVTGKGYLRPTEAICLSQHLRPWSIDDI